MQNQKNRTAEGFISDTNLDPMNMTFNKSGNKSMSNECPYKDISNTAGQSLVASQLKRVNKDVKKDLNFSLEQPNFVLDSAFKGSIFAVKGMP